MKYILPVLAVFILAGCCRIPVQQNWQASTALEPTDAVYSFHLERSDQTRLAGLLALKYQKNGIWAGLLDATGIPLVKILVRHDGSPDIQYCAAAVCDTKLPEILGKLINYIYFTTPSSECPWYSIACVCELPEEGNKRIKWKRFGPLRSWEVTHEFPPGEKERLEIKMYFSMVKIQLQRISTP